MYDPRNQPPPGGNPYGNPYGGQQPDPRYQQQQQQQYQYPGMAPYGGASIQASSLISKVMGLLAASFVIATLGAALGPYIITNFVTAIIVFIAAFGTLILLNVMIHRQGWNLFLLYLFTFLQGLSIGPLIDAYFRAGAGPIVAQAFLITTVTCIALALYAWTTKSDFSKIGHFLFVGLIVIIVASIFNFLVFQSTALVLIITLAGIGIFCGFMLYDVQRARRMADTLPNAIELTVSIFLNFLNLFLFILRLLGILQSND